MSLGEDVILAIAGGRLVRVVCEDEVDRAHVFVWSANAAEQIEMLVKDKLAAEELKKQERTDGE